jgi:hypothetical protein
MADKYFTVVFQIHDKESFQDHLNSFTEAMISDGIFPGASVSGCGWGDSMSEAEIYQQELIANDIELPEISE